MSQFVKDEYRVVVGATLTIMVIAISAMVIPKRKTKASKETEPSQPDTWESHVDLHHGPLREVWPKTLYMLEAPGCPKGPPVRNMIIYRVPDSVNRRLVIFNAIAVKESTMAEILALGSPAVLVIPNYMHRCCAAVWKARFPELLVVCPEAAHTAASETVAVDQTTQEWTQQAEWKSWVQAKEIQGWAPFETILQCELDASGKGKKAMLVADLLFTLPYNKDAGIFEKLVMWVFDSSVMETAGNTKKLVIPKVSRVARLFGILDWKLAEQWYRTYALEDGSNIAVIAVGHGPPVVELNSDDGCTEALHGIADQLIRPRW